jgi:ATP-dependent Clp protease ATP-binding subunit ClpC
VRYTRQAIKSAVELSAKYIHDRKLPDKAIDVIDEAGARVRLKSMTKPPNLAEIEEQIERLSIEKDEAVKNADYERAAELRDQAEALRKKKEEMQKQWREQAKEVDGVVDEEMIAEVVSKITGVPLTRLEKKEAQRLLELENELHKRVVSQDDAIKAVARSIRRARSGLKDPNRPIGTFLFLGPSGVGKTLLSKAIAEFMFGSEEALVQIDMSEYMEKHNVSRLIGAPPGYVGYEEGGQLTERIRRRPYAVVLLDEIEKAHPDVFNVLLQLLDDGRLTDGQGRTVDFTNAVLIMTSNLPGDPRDFFKPEFINRIDEIVRFRELTEDDLGRIVEIQLRGLRDRLAARRIGLEVTDAATTTLAHQGYDPSFGARPLKRVIQRELADKLALLLLDGKIGEGDTVTVDAVDGALVLR